jgi:ech hydrogenase subunit D
VDALDFRFRISIFGFPSDFGFRISDFLACMSQTQTTFELVTPDALLARVGVMRQQGCRLVQISATRLPEQIELTYSFDLDSRLTNLRLHVPAVDARVPSISAIYWCAFLYENEMHDLFNLQVDGMAVDFHGSLYKTAVPYPFGSAKAPAAKPAATTTIS